MPYNTPPRTEPAMPAGTPSTAEPESVELGYYSEDYDVIDDDGNVIDPAAEGSYVMAEALSEMARAETGTDTIVFEPYVPDFDVAARQAEAEAFFASNNARDVENRKYEAGSVESAEKEEEGVDGDYDDDDGMVEHHSMGPQIVTDPDDWVLERILKRKVNKEREGGLWQYQCKWKGYDEPTWETREVMEDAGWIPQLDAFDAKGIHKKSTKNPNIAHALSLESCYNRLISFFGGFDEMTKKIRGCGTTHCHWRGIMEYCRVNTRLVRPFYERWEQLRATHVPMIVYHGTRTQNLRSIAASRLMVGGKGIPVANGAVFGQGVYTASAPDTPLGYSSEAVVLIICIGLVPRYGGDSVIRASRDYLIFREAHDVLPLWYARVTAEDESIPPQKILLDQFISLALRSFSKGSTDQCQFDEESIDERKVRRAKAALRNASGGVSKAALKAQPRQIKDLLNKAAGKR